MKLSRSVCFLVMSVLVMFSGTAAADDLILVRSNQAFPEAMRALQMSIRQHGYSVARVQRVDIGLTKSGYKTDKYRVVFFGKNKEMLSLIKKHEELVAYLPLKVSIYAEGDETILLALNPRVLKRFFPAKDLAPVFDHWEKDVNSIITSIIKAED